MNDVEALMGVPPLIDVTNLIFAPDDLRQVSNSVDDHF